MWAKQEVSVTRVNQREKGKSIMYNRIGKKNRMVVASARVATRVGVAKVVLGFSVQYQSYEKFKEHFGRKNLKLCFSET